MRNISLRLPTALFSDDWLARAQARVNADPELRLIGGWFTTAFSLTCGDRRGILRFERGRLVESVRRPRLDVRCAFGFRALSRDLGEVLRQTIPNRSTTISSRC